MVQTTHSTQGEKLFEQVINGRNLLYGFGTKLNSGQVCLLHSLLTEDITITNSKAGTGKTVVTIAAAKLLKQAGLIDRLMYVFSPVQEGAMGHFPGEAKDKYERYIAPLMDALIEVGDMPEKALDPRFGWVTAVPHSFLRGSTHQRTYMVIDEAQNFTKEEMKRTISRAHTDSGSKIAVLGHSGQIDLKVPSRSCLESLIDHFQYAPGCGVVELKEQNFRGWVSEYVDKW